MPIKCYSKTLTEVQGEAVLTLCWMPCSRVPRIENKLKVGWLVYAEGRGCPASASRDSLVLGLPAHVTINESDFRRIYAPDDLQGCNKMHDGL